MERMYNVIAVIECQKMMRHGEKFKMNATPMTHKQACTFMSKLTKHTWRRVMLEEVV